MPHDPKVSSVKFENGRFYIEQHEAPAEVDDRGNYLRAEDPFQQADADMAKAMMVWLDKHFPMGGYWATNADLKQGICWFNIPALMGQDFVWRINLRTHSDVPMEMHKGAGEILERYDLPRGRFDADRFAAARAKHSRLVLPTRQIPG